MLNVLTQISRFAIPAIFLMVVSLGIQGRVAVYEAFVAGAKNSLFTTARILPNLVAMLVAVQIFRLSGALELVTTILRPVTSFFAIPEEIIPLVLVRPLSGSGALGVLAQLFADYGPDSLIGRMASAIMGTTETTFYVLTVYTGAVGIKQIRHTLVTSLLTDLIGFIAAIFITFAVFT